MNENLSPEDKELLEMYSSNHSGKTTTQAPGYIYAFIAGALTIFILIFVCILLYQYKQNQRRQRLVRTRRSSCFTDSQVISAGRHQLQRSTDSGSLPPTYSGINFDDGEGDPGLRQHQQLQQQAGAQMVRPPPYLQDPPTYSESEDPPPYSPKDGEDGSGSSGSSGSSSAGTGDDAQDVRKRCNLT